MYKFAGSSEHEVEIIEKINPSPKEQISSAVRARITWLIITLIGGLLSTAYNIKFRYYNESNVCNISIFHTCCNRYGGNIGTQSSALTVMTLSNKDLDYKNVIREGVVGFITGIICSCINSVLLFYIYKRYKSSISCFVIIIYKYDSRSNDRCIYACITKKNGFGSVYNLRHQL